MKWQKKCGDQFILFSLGPTSFRIPSGFLNAVYKTSSRDYNLIFMLKKFIPVLVFVIFNVGQLTAQQFDWVKKVGIKRSDANSPLPATWDIDAKIETDPAGNIILAGNFKETLEFE